VNAIVSVSLGTAFFLLALGVVLWMEVGEAVFRAMMDVGFLLCQ
jgi:hypothetical protein